MKGKRKQSRKTAKDLENNGLPSTVRSNPGRANPFFDRMRYIIEQRQRLFDMQNEIKAISKGYMVANGSGPNAVDMAGLMHDPEMIRLKEEYKALRQEIDAIETTKNVMPDPPKREELYSRISKSTPIVDVGCGSEDTLNKVSNIREHLTVVKNIDPLIPTGDEVPNTVLNNFSAIEDEKSTNVGFNSFTQLSEKEQEKLMEQDGIYVAPDLEELQEMGVTAPVGDGNIYESHDKSGIKYLDKLVPKCIGDYPIKAGYKAFNTYKRREITGYVEETQIKGGKPFVPQALATHPTISLDVGYKNDGEAVRLEFKNNRVRMQFRNGNYIAGYTDFDGAGIITCELIRFQEQKVCLLILHRVNYWKSFVPFHSGDCLRYFGKRVKIKLRSETFEYTVMPPKVFLGERDIENTFNYLKEGEVLKLKVKTDGIIIRRNETDYYSKYVWTFDHNDPDAVLEKMEQHGFHFTNDPGEYGQPKLIDQFGWDEDIHEFQLIMSSNNLLTIHYNCPRPDKTYADSFDKILWRCNLAF